MAIKQKITPFLWFDKDASKIAKFYASIFKGSKIISSSILENTPSGTVEVARVKILGQEITLMSAGPVFKLNESISFVIDCKDQKEVDYYWDSLSEGGSTGQCGWLKDKYGLSWQIVPSKLSKLLGNKDKAKSEKVMQAMLKMTKLNISELENAAKSK